MNEIIKKLKDLNFKKKNFLMVAIGIIALLVLIIMETPLSKPIKNNTAENIADYNSEYYIEKTEKDLQKLLEQISGAGKIKVMITLESKYENIYAKGYNSKSDNSNNSKSNEVEEDYIIVKKGSNNEECLIQKIKEPSVKGVAVIAQGADDITVKTAITETVCALFNISSAKVSVTKMINK